jgi:putative transposase
MDLTDKILVHPTYKVKEILWSISHLCTWLRNTALTQRRDRKSWGKVNYYSQQNELPQIKKDFPEFKLPCSQVLQYVLRDLDKSYISFFSLIKQGDKEARPPKYKPGKQFYTQTYPQRGISFEITDTCLLRLAYGKSKKDHLELQLPKANYDNVKLVKISYRKGNFFAHLTYTVEEASRVESNETIYFDPGCKTTLTGIKTPDLKFIEYDINPLRKINLSTLKLIDKLMSKRDTKKRGSYHWRRLNKRIQKLWNKINNRTKTYLHTLANIILKHNPNTKDFRVGNWNPKETKADTPNEFVNHIINRAVQNNNPLRTLIGILSYKAELLGQKVVDFNERGTTRTCSMCGHVHESGVSPKVRVFICEACGFKYSRDHQSCLNFIKMFDSASWRSLLGRPEGLPSCSERVSLYLLSFKPYVSDYEIVSSM